MIEPYIRPLSYYHRLFDKIHLLSNNGTFGIVYSVMNKDSRDYYVARHVKVASSRANLNEEASILWQMKNVLECIQLQGLYEGPTQSVLVTDFRPCSQSCSGHKKK